MTELSISPDELDMLFLIYDLQARREGESVWKSRNESVGGDNVRHQNEALLRSPSFLESYPVRCAHLHRDMKSIE